MRTNKPIGLTFLYAIYRFYVTGSCVVVTFVLLYCFPGPYRERVD